MSPLLGIWASSIQGSKATSFDSIATNTVGGGGVSTVTFSSIPGTYKHLQVRMLFRNTAFSGGGAEENLRVQFNSDTAANYSSHALIGNGASASAWAFDSNNNTFILPSYGMIPMSDSTASVFGVAVLDILDYADTNKYKTVKCLGGNDKNGSGYANFSSGNWRSTSAINAIKLYPQAGSFSQYSAFALYGIK